MCTLENFFHHALSTGLCLVSILLSPMASEDKSKGVEDQSEPVCFADFDKLHTASLLP